MNILLILIYFLIGVILWCLIPMVIRFIVNEYNHNEPVLVKHEYDKEEARFFYEWLMTSWHYRIMGRKLVCNMEFCLRSVRGNPVNVPVNPNEDIPDAPRIHDEQQLKRMEYWTNAPTSEIKARGYKTAYRLHDGLIWVRVPRYLMIAGAQKFIVPQDKDENGQYIYPQVTPAIMYDKFTSRASEKFKKSLSKLATRQLDAHALLMLVIMIAGAVCGMFMLGII